MGVDLTLLPIDMKHANASHTMLRLTRDRDMYDRICAANPVPLQKPL